MTTIASLAATATLIGDPARAAMLVTLMDGRALTAGELAAAAGVTPPTASGHLMRMLEAGLLALERQGRHRYYRLASTSVAALLEQLMSLSGELRDAAGSCKPIWTGPRDRALRRARLCYDHLAGELAVAIADAMVARGQLEFAQDGGMLSAEGIALLESLGVHADGPGTGGATLCRPCLDWSERRPHLAGSVARSMYAAFRSNGWVREPVGGRAVAVTPLGLREFTRHFGVVLSPIADPGPSGPR